MTNIKNIIIGVLIIISLSLVSVLKLQNEKVIKLTTDLSIVTEQNYRMSNQMDELGKALREKTANSIETVKEVMVNICDGKLLAQSIDNLPKRVVTNEKQNSKSNVADIDDALPDELVRLLQ